MHTRPLLRSYIHTYIYCINYFRPIDLLQGHVSASHDIEYDSLGLRNGEVQQWGRDRRHRRIYRAGLSFSLSNAHQRRSCHTHTNIHIHTSVRKTLKITVFVYNSYKACLIHTFIHEYGPTNHINTYIHTYIHIHHLRCP